MPGATTAQLPQRASRLVSEPPDADGHTSVPESPRAAAPRKCQKKLPLQMQAAPLVKTCKAGSREHLPPLARPARPRTARTRLRLGQEFQASTHHKLERKRVAAAGNRKGYRRQEEVRKQLRLEDFGEHALSRANGMCPIVDRQSTVNRSSCGRRTSLTPSAEF